MQVKGRVALLAAFALTACAGVNLAKSGRQSLRFAGGVRIEVPETYGEVRAIDVTTLGAGVDTSAFLGWRRGQFVFVKPNECQLLIIVRSTAQAEHAAAMIDAMKGEKTCLVDFARSLPRL